MDWGWEGGKFGKNNVKVNGKINIWIFIKILKNKSIVRVLRFIGIKICCKDRVFKMVWYRGKNR